MPLQRPDAPTGTAPPSPGLGLNVHLRPAEADRLRTAPNPVQGTTSKESS